MKNRIGDAQLTIEFLGRYKPLEIEREMFAIAEREDLSQIMHLDDGTYDAPLIVVVIQAVPHGIDHRSQIATLLSQQGIKPPDLDAWAYNDATFAKT